MNLKTLLIGIVALAIVGVGALFVTRDVSSKPSSIKNDNILSFEDCIKAGYPAMESHPRQCRTADGRLYVEEVKIAPQYENASANNIIVELPFPGAVTEKEFSVTGKARGQWYFEASFPIYLLDKGGNVIATGIAQAQGEWMTEEFVSFKATIKAPDSYTGLATLVLKKDNPSGLPEHDASISFPITVEY